MPRHAVLNGARLACGVGLVALLLWQASGHDALARLRETPPDSGRLAASWGAVVAGSVLAFLRWRAVAHAAGIPMSVGEALRLGALGFACNFVALGSVGGDVVKAALLAKGRPGRRSAAVTTVLVDRLLGLTGFLTYAAAAVLVTGAAASSSAALRLLSQSTLAAAALALSAFGAVFAPGRPLERVAAFFGRVPLLSSIGARVGELTATYRNGWRSLLTAGAIGLAMNGVFILSFALAASALPLQTPSLVEHLLIVPLALISGTLPISPNGLGTIEATTEYLYRAIDPATTVGAGTLAALAHRLAMLLAGVAAAGLYYATATRRRAPRSAAITSEAAAGSGTEAVGAATASRHTV